MKELHHIEAQIADIDRWLTEYEIHESRLGMLACGNSRAVHRIRNGSATVATLNDVLDYVRTRCPHAQLDFYLLAAPDGTFKFGHSGRAQSRREKFQEGFRDSKHDVVLKVVATRREETVRAAESWAHHIMLASGVHSPRGEWYVCSEARCLEVFETALVKAKSGLPPANGRSKRVPGRSVGRPKTVWSEIDKKIIQRHWFNEAHVTDEVATRAINADGVRITAGVIYKLFGKSKRPMRKPRRFMGGVSPRSKVRDR